jgi:beta-ketodecanoyl-[acyl-carrier-protein] synthase
MQNIHLAGTGIWYPDNLITNDELVKSFNSYVDHFNQANEKGIKDGKVEAMLHSSSEFIEKASGIETRYVIDKEGILDISRMMPRVINEDESRLSVHAKMRN